MSGLHDTSEFVRTYIASSERRDCVLPNHQCDFGDDSDTYIGVSGSDRRACAVRCIYTSSDQDDGSQDE